MKYSYFSLVYAAPLNHIIMSLPLIQGLGHVGVVVPSINEAREFYTSKLGIPTTEPKELAKGLLISFAELQNAKIEIIQPLDMDSPHGKFLKDHPKGGVHHICFNTSKLEPAVKEVNKVGIEATSEDPLVLTTGERVIFLNEEQTLGTITEFYETNQ